MNKNYNSPEIEIVLLNSQDVITMSQTMGGQIAGDTATDYSAFFGNLG